MKAEFEKSNPQIRRMLHIDFPDVTRRYSDVALCSSTYGLHEPLVKTWGVIEHAGGDAQCNLQVPQWSGLQIIDVDKEWQTLASIYRLRGLVVRFIIGSPNVPDPLDWFEREFWIDEWDYPEEGLVGVRLVPPYYHRLKSPYPLSLINTVDFPNLPAESQSLYPPIGPYGRFDSFGVGTIDGTIHPILVDPTTNTYMLSTGGCIKQVLHVYRDGVKTPPSLNYFVVNVQINARSYTLLTFENPQVNFEITVDVEGYETEGDSTGALIDRPMAVLRHWLANKVFFETVDAFPTDNGWIGDADTPIDPVYFDETEDYLERRTPTGYRCCFYGEPSDAQRDGISDLNDFCQTNQVMAFYTIFNLLAVRPDSFDDPGYIDAPWMRRQVDELDSGPLEPSDPSEDVVTTIVVDGNVEEATGQILDHLQVNSQPSDGASDSIASSWGEGYI